MQNCCHMLCVALAVLLLGGCSRSEQNDSVTTTPSNVIQSNQQRSLIGLRLIKPTWFFYRKEFGSEDWKLARTSSSLCKRVHREADSLLWEEDYYYSGRTFTTAEGTFQEYLTLHYDYSTKSAEVHYVGNDPTAETIVAPYREPTTNFPSAAAAVDKVLRKWGVSRL